ncbi:hypothetical protein JAAARDRAFT_34991 [Jaapia argillacea MUCL 33604]|uniref:Protein kinase domain-containing protein n=1 Tax=Jaapia argillacea MUCL 33604 TaxID=933084 RepID=A0A067PTN0_9AGAM|nr:hypothetical protein JAAARDRAFT_34991 [Jaapia argillacea MUCL 33604]
MSWQQTCRANLDVSVLPSGQKVVVKRLRRPGWIPKRFSEFLRIQKTLQANVDIYVAPLNGISSFADPFLSLIVPQHGIDVLNYLKPKRPDVSHADLLELVTQVARGLAHCHSLGIPHGRVRSSNVLVDQDGLVKLVDVAWYLLHSDEGYNVGEVVVWTAPELLASSEDSDEFVSPSSATDVYSLAMTILEIFTGAPPFSEFKPRSTSFIFRMQTDPGMIALLRQPSGMPDGLWEILEASWNRDASLRPTAPSVLQQLQDLAGGPHLVQA